MGLTHIELSKYTATKTVGIAPIAYSLQMLLVSYFDGKSNSGVINPKISRILHQLRINEHEFANALAPLLQSGMWQISTDSDNFTGLHVDWTLLPIEQVSMILESTGVHNIVEFTPLYLSDVHDAKEALSEKRVALNHLKFLTRYTGMEAGLGHALQINVATLIDPKYQDLGYNQYRKQGIVPKFQLPNSNGQLRKLCHSVWFQHGIMSASTESEWETLFNLVSPTPRMMEHTKTATIKIRDIARKYALTDPISEIRQAWNDIIRAGYFDLAFIGDTENPMDGAIKFIPQPKIHKAVWDLEKQPGGQRITQWELENGHIPVGDIVEGNDPMVNLPKLGYHWLYLTKSHKTGEYLTVGQTTVSLRTRLYQHKTYGTNTVVHGVIEAINNDPEDQLLIEPIGLVHHSVTAEMEMRALWKMRQKGHRMYNVLDSIERNRSTIFLDARLQAMSTWEQNNVLTETMKTHGAVIFQSELPNPL